MTDADPFRPGRRGSDLTIERRGRRAGTVPVMAPWSPVALPPRFVAARRTRLVGRRYELGVVEGVWERVCRAHGQVLLIGGEPGAGKTRLAAEVAGCAARAGRRGAGGHGDQGRRGALPAVRRDAGPPVPAPASRARWRAAGRAAAAVPARRPPRRGRRPRPAGDGRHDLFEAVAALFRSIAQDRPLVVVLDDLHWAQLPTVALLEHVVHSCLDTPTLVLATFRTTAPDRSDELSARLADLHRLDGVRRLDLGGLDTDAIAEFVCEHAGVPPSGPGPRGDPARPDRREPVLPPRDLDRPGTARRRRRAARPATGPGLDRRHRGGPAGRPRTACGRPSTWPR